MNNRPRDAHAGATGTRTRHGAEKDCQLGDPKEVWEGRDGVGPGGVVVAREGEFLNRIPRWLQASTACLI